MKTLITALAAVATVTAVAAPAAAQPYRGEGRYEQTYRDHDRYAQRWTSERVRTAERRIESGLQSGQLTRREAYRLRSELDEFARLEANSRRGGVSRWERAQLEQRWDSLVQQIRYETRDREYGYGYGSRR